MVGLQAAYLASHQYWIQEQVSSHFSCALFLKSSLKVTSTGKSAPCGDCRFGFVSLRPPMTASGNGSLSPIRVKTNAHSTRPTTLVTTSSKLSRNASDRNSVLFELYGKDSTQAMKNTAFFHAKCTGKSAPLRGVHCRLWSLEWVTRPVPVPASLLAPSSQELALEHGWFWLQRLNDFSHWWLGDILEEPLDHNLLLLHCCTLSFCLSYSQVSNHALLRSLWLWPSLSLNWSSSYCLLGNSASWRFFSKLGKLPGEGLRC